MYTTSEYKILDIYKKRKTQHLVVTNGKRLYNFSDCSGALRFERVQVPFLVGTIKKVTCVNFIITSFKVSQTLNIYFKALDLNFVYI